MKNPFKNLFGSVPEASEPEPLREAVGATVDSDDAEWRPLSGDGRRDLAPMTQRRMQELAVYLWESNLLGNRLIELPAAYILAEGVQLQASDELVQEQLDRFWADPVNNMSLKLPKKVRELALYGEQCWPAFVNEFSGAVRLGYLDPAMIESVVVDPDNGEQPIGVITVKNAADESRRYRIIVNGSEESVFTRRTRELRATFDDGECFYFCVNDLSNGRRGRSDILSQIDWLDNYDQFLFGELDRTQFLRAFMWDVTVNGANEDEVLAKAGKIRPPKPGSVRVHNEQEIWKAESPNLNASDTDITAKLFRNHVLGGATIPEHWFGGAGDVNRATGEDMSGPTFKIMSMRQAYLGYMLLEVARYVIRRWELAHNGKEPDLSDPAYAISVKWPEMVAKDTTRYAAALQQVTAAVVQAIQNKLLSRKTAVEMLEAIAGRLGVGFDAESELTAIEAETPAAPEAATPAVNTPESPAEQPEEPAPLQEAARNARHASIADPPSQMLDSVERAVQPVVDTMLEAVLGLLENATDLQEVMRRLPGLLPSMPVDDMAAVLAQAMLEANLAGRDQVGKGL